MGDLRRLARRIDNRDYREKGHFSDVNMLVWVWFTGSSGRGMYMSWSRQPGLRMAGSMISGRLVAPIINTFFLELIPSISVRTWLITRSAAPPYK